MTTAALIAGMAPMALGTGAGAGTRRTVAIVVIGGQAMALLLTLLVTPVAYSLFDDLAHSRLLKRLFGGGRSTKTAEQIVASLLLLAVVLGAPLSAQTQPPLSHSAALEKARREVAKAPRVGGRRERAPVGAR